MNGSAYALLVSLFLMALPSAQQERKTVVQVAGLDVEITGDLHGFSLASDVTRIEDRLEVLSITLRSPSAQPPPRLVIRWSIPSHDVAGHWMTGRFLNKSIRPDWSAGRLQASMFAREAPVSCLFSSDNRNVLAFAVSDALETVSAGAGVREEDGLVYNDVILFAERRRPLAEFRVAIRLDRRNVPYETALGDVSDWWAKQPGYRPAQVPETARLPMYSTWYSYHQSVDATALLKEVAVAKTLGFSSIIVDDGWQTLDSSRGYAYTGDWQPERMPGMKTFAEGCHALGVKVLLWYSVPFVGTHAKAAALFKNKSLRFDDRLGAFVLDPRYPEVRQYLIDIYTKAVREWNLDGLKLDFIDRFVADEQTVLEASDGRDFGSVNEAANRLMTDVLAALIRVKPDVMVEFRQPYIGPLIRTYGNMFRASDSPNAAVANRVKTIDLRLLSGTTAVHADMIMWHSSEPVEVAALQYLNILFSVPQVSVRLQDIPPDHLAMVRFYTQYWIANRAVLLDGQLSAPVPLANYPLVRSHAGGTHIVALYADLVVPLDGEEPVSRVDVINAKHSAAVVLAVNAMLGRYTYSIRDCQGRLVRSGDVRLDRGLMDFEVPMSGVLTLERRP
jgi:alpha-galactosidase